MRFTFKMKYGKICRVINMRMRKKPNLIPRMEKCARVLEETPESRKGKWLSDYPGHRVLWAELGCGKGRFTLETAQQNPDALICAVERVPDAMVIGMERVCEANATNVRFLRVDAVRLEEFFEEGELSRIYINFCDPWLPKRHHKRRLTAPSFLALYKKLLASGGEIHFKTDNVDLYEWSLEQFAACGWELREVTRDLHENGPVGVMTDYEAKFYSQGVKINRCVAVRPE